MVQAKHKPDSNLQQLTVFQLNLLPTKRLLAHLHSVRAVISSIASYYGQRCCEMCHEYVGNDWEGDVGKYLHPLQVYEKLVKKILSGREHIPRGKEARPQYKKPSKARLRMMNKSKKKLSY